MFCPNCKAEYRDGASRCSDCHIGLVSDLPAESSPQAFDVLWRGEDPILHDTLRGELETAGIEYADPPLEVFLRRYADPLSFSINPKFGFVVCVRAEAIVRARAILEELLGREPADAWLPEIAEGSNAGTPIDASPLPLHWNPLTATVEVWTGHNRDKLDFLSRALQEVGIPSRSIDGEQGILLLSVRPEDETTAREIIRQVLEAAVPNTSVRRPEEDIWYDEPVRSYLFAWLPAVLYLFFLGFVAVFFSSFSGMFDRYSPFDPLFSLVSFVCEVAFFWMIYQAARYELRPLRFVLLAFLPFSFVWYYYERYSRRQGRGRLPIVVRERMSTRPHA